MPEGHTIHRLAEDYAAAFADGSPLRVTSPQGKFSDAAALLDRTPLHTADAHGKHLFLGFRDPDPEHTDWVHIHLGLFGKVALGPAPAPPPTADVRLRLAHPAAYADLRGPTTCALITGAEKRAIHDRLGPDPLRPDAEPDGAYRRISRSRTTIAALLMDQKVIAGVGNVYRAEVLFRHGIDPYRAGRDITPAERHVLLDRPGRADARGRPQQPHRHRPSAAHPGGDGPPAARRRPRRGVRLPPGPPALPHLRRRDPHRRSRRPQPLLVPGLPTPVDNFRRTPPRRRPVKLTVKQVPRTRDNQDLPCQVAGPMDRVPN
ncbi:Formamidopyrimidine-DNA glycosylase [Streptomyces hirsutus]